MLQLVVLLRSRVRNIATKGEAKVLIQVFRGLGVLSIVTLPMPSVISLSPPIATAFELGWDCVSVKVYHWKDLN